MERDDHIARNKAIYCRYLACCNMHAFERLGEFVSESVKVNGKPCGLADYTRGLLSVVEAFPDYQWALEHLIGEGD